MTTEKHNGLQVLRQAREILDKTYIKWNLEDGSGGHCAVGAINRAVGCAVGCHSAACALVGLLNATARQLHPELIGSLGRRPYSGHDWFDGTELVYINNQLGKEATLAVFDAAILDLELALALSPQPEVSPTMAGAGLLLA